LQLEVQVSALPGESNCVSRRAASRAYAAALGINFLVHAM
jgi:hypothetical protein